LTQSWRLRYAFHASAKQRFLGGGRNHGISSARTIEGYEEAKDSDNLFSGTVNMQIIRVKESVYYELFKVYGEEVVNLIPSGCELTVVCDFTGLALLRIRRS
jgi:hypothetical protein